LLFFFASVPAPPPPLNLSFCWEIDSVLFTFLFHLEVKYLSPGFFSISLSDPGGMSVTPFFFSPCFLSCKRPCFWYSGPVLRLHLWATVFRAPFFFLTIALGWTVVLLWAHVCYSSCRSPPILPFLFPYDFDPWGSPRIRCVVRYSGLGFFFVFLPPFLACFVEISPAAGWGCWFTFFLGVCPLTPVTLVGWLGSGL